MRPQCAARHAAKCCGGSHAAAPPRMNGFASATRRLRPRASPGQFNRDTFRVRVVRVGNELLREPKRAQDRRETTRDTHVGPQSVIGGENPQVVGGWVVRFSRLLTAP